MGGDSSLEIFITKTESCGNTSKNRSVAHITEHHTEKERECDDREQSRISLLIPWDTVCVNDLLIDTCEFVCLNVCRPGDGMVLIRRDPYCLVALEAI